MGTQANIQKRKRADTVPNEHAIDLSALNGPTIIIDHQRHRLPSNIKEDSDNSNIDQPDNKPLKKSTLFQSIQLVFSMQEGDKMRIAMPSLTDNLLKNTLALLRKIFIIKSFYNLT